jgi:Fe-S-cluster-containing hydrogenase component 2
MEKVLIVDPDKCTGCRQCEMACSMSNHGEFRPSLSNIRVLRNKEMDLNLPVWGVGCAFCGECVSACLSKALMFVPFEEAILQWKGVKSGPMPAPLMKCA